MNKKVSGENPDLQIHYILGNKMSESEDIDILREEMSQYQEKLQEIMQHNKELVKENNDLLDRFQTSQNYATELKAR